MIDRLFFDHPRSVDESYPEHAGVALRVGATMIAAGAACVVHGIVPALFTRTGSDAIRTLHARLGERRRPSAATTPAAEWQLTYDI